MANLGYDRRDFAVPQWAAFSLIFQVQATSAGVCSYRAAGVLSFSNTESGEITLVEYVVSLDKLGVHDVEHVGGKNASLGEMISNLAGAGVSVPGGFATTAQAYRDFSS